MRNSASLFFVVAVSALCFASNADAHITVQPTGRMGTSDANKFIQNNMANPVVADSPGPCSTYNTPTATRLQLKAGQDFSFTIQETIDHPGRFYVQFRQDAAQNFWTPANRLALVEDTQVRGTTVVPFKVPSVTCDTCMLRVLQQMDDNPGTFYVHCYDVTITSDAAAATPPVTGTEGKSSVSNTFQKPGFGGCGTVSKSDGPNGTGGNGLASVLALMLMPLAVAFARRRQFAIELAKVNSN